MFTPVCLACTNLIESTLTAVCLSLWLHQIAAGQLEPRRRTVRLKVGDALYIPAGVHHEVYSYPDTRAFSIGIKTPVHA